jgi:hypothetical protein
VNHGCDFAGQHVPLERNGAAAASAQRGPRFKLQCLRMDEARCRRIVIASPAVNHSRYLANKISITLVKMPSRRLTSHTDGTAGYTVRTSPGSLVNAVRYNCHVAPSNATGYATSPIMSGSTRTVR